MRIDTSDGTIYAMPSITVPLVSSATLIDSTTDTSCDLSLHNLCHFAYIHKDKDEVESALRLAVTRKLGTFKRILLHGSGFRKL
jgi:hypothetical protein